MSRGTHGLPVFARALRESWRGVALWTAGLAAVLYLHLPLFPSIGGSGEMQAIIDSLPAELVSSLGYDQIGSGAGYTQATFFGLMGFLLLTIAVASWGSGAIAGAEESERLELDLAHAIGRASYAGQAALALLARPTWLVVSAGIVTAALNGSAQLGRSQPRQALRWSAMRSTPSPIRLPTSSGCTSSRHTPGPFTSLRSWRVQAS